jgi:hypothetical protein
MIERDDDPDPLSSDAGYAADGLGPGQCNRQSTDRQPTQDGR